MKSVAALVVLAIAVAANPAEASTCVLGPYVLSLEPAADCPVVVWRMTGSVDPAPRAYVYREGARIDVTDTTTPAGTTSLDYRYVVLDCHDNIIEENPLVATMDVFHVTFTGAQVGEKIWVDGIPIATVQPAGGACTLYPPQAEYCAGTYHESTCEPGHDDPWSDGDDTAGCRATSGAPTGVVGLALLALLAGGRRRRRA
jgi:MYXO-CTERM domain-containing protein